MFSISIATWTKTAILLVIIWEPILGWRRITDDAIIQNVWPDNHDDLARDSAKIKRASSANTGTGKGKQVPPKTPQSFDTPSQDDDDGLIFEGRYFNPNEVPPPPPFMVVHDSNWRAKSPSNDNPSPPPPPPPTIQKQERPSTHYTGGGRGLTPPQTSQKFTAENAKSVTNDHNVTTDTEPDSESGNSRNVLISSPIPLEDLQYHEEELIAFEAAYKDAPKCYTPTDVPGRCIPFRNCFPVVFNVIDGDLRNPGLAKLLYQASGPCNASLELDFALHKAKDHKKYFDAKFYNQSICCPGFKHPPTLLKAWTNDVRSARLIPTNSQNPANEGDTSTTTASVSESEPSSSKVENDSVDNDPFITTTGGLEEAPTSTKSRTPPLKADENSAEIESNRDSEIVFDDASDSDGDRGAPIEFHGVVEIEENDDSVEREQLALVETEIVKEHPKISAIANYTRLDDSEEFAEVRHGDRIKVKENSKRPSDTFLAVEPPSVSPSCQHQMHGMPRGHWPWMVALVVSSRHICSGALLDDRHILTAAHCVYLLNEADVKKLRLIIGDRVMYSSIDGPHFWRKVSKITTHVNYNQQTFASDIAILRMNSAVPFSRNVQPISLPDGSFDSTNFRNAIVAGWSGADIGQPAFEPRTEVETVVDIMDKRECHDIYRGFALSGIATNTFCTKPANNSCVADSGAPLIVRVQNCWRLVGIMSWGIGCSHFPEVYTDVSRYMSWVRKHLE